MASRSKPDEAPASAPEPGSAGNINQIRDILIGPFQRDQAARFDRLEQALERVARESEDRTARAQEKLQKGIEAAVAGLQARVADLTKRLEQLDETTRRNASQLAGDIEREIREVQTRLASEIQESDRATDARITAQRAELDAALATLRDEKTSRHDLGDYLTEIGLRLKGAAALAELDASLENALHGGKQSKQP